MRGKVKILPQRLFLLKATIDGMMQVGDRMAHSDYEVELGYPKPKETCAEYIRKDVVRDMIKEAVKAERMREK